MESPAQTRALLKLLPATLILATILFSLGWRALDFSRPVAPEQDWKLAAAHTLKHIQPNDAVWVQPWWDESVLPSLSTLKPEQVLRQRTLINEDLEDISTLWLITAQDRAAEARAWLPIKPSDAQVTTHGQVEVIALKLPKDAVSYPYTLRKHLAQAKVEHVEPKKSPTPCTAWDEANQRWRCPNTADEFQPAASTQELGDEVHDCIWATPPGKNKTLRFSFNEVPLGAKLRLRAGLTLRAARRGGEPVTWRARIDDKTLINEQLPLKHTEWKPYELDTAAWANQRKTLIIEIDAKHDDKRFFCFNGWVLP